MAIAIKKNANLIVKDGEDSLVHILPSTRADLVAYGDESNVAGEIQAIEAALEDKADVEHSHGGITSDGKIGEASGRPLITGAGGAIQTGVFGTAAGTFAEGNDSRLSDAREPLPHNQASSTITSLQGYQKALSAEAISSSDTLNSALGKLEKQLEGMDSAAKFSTQTVSSDTLLSGGSPSEISIVSCTGEIEVTLPYFDSSIEGNPSSYWIKNTGDDEVTVACDTNVSIDGSSSGIVLAPGESVLLYALTDGEYSVASDGRWQSAVQEAYDLASAKQSPATSISGYGITDAYTKTEIDQMMNSAMHYKGSVSTYNALPATGNSVGDFYNVTDTGANYAYTGVQGSEWDVMGSLTAGITASEIDAIVDA